MEKKIKIFCDFDGTITTADVGDELFRAFSEFDLYFGLLIKGDISITDYYNRMVGSLKKGLKEKEIADFALNFGIDNYFKKFAVYCGNSDIGLCIVSDGLDVYINPILEKAGLKHIPLHCNYLVKNGNGWKAQFPAASESCTCLCASCKRNIILTNSGADELLVYIGDGISDFCAARHCDIIFAKNELAAFCSMERIPHYPFKSFFDIYSILKNSVSKNNLKSRNQARLLRKKAYETE